MSPTTSPAEDLTTGAPGLRRALMRSTLAAFIGTGASQGSTMLRVFLGAKLLGPAVFGVWLGIRLLIDYAVVLDLGTLPAMQRQVALSSGRGDAATVETAKQTTFAFISATGLLAFLGVCGASLLPRYRAERVVLLAVALLVPANLVRGYYVSYFKARHRFRELAQSQILGAGFTLATLPLIALWGMAGLAWGMLIQSLSEPCWLALRSELPRLGLDRKMLRALLAFGLPASGIVLLAVALGRVDHTVVLATLGTEQLGYYGIALIVVTMLSNLAAVPNMVLSPRFSERYGQTGRPADLMPLYVKPLAAMTIGFALIVGVAYLALPPLVEHLLPKYRPGVGAARIVMLGCYCAVVTGVSASSLTALDHLKRYLAILGGATALSYGLAQLAVWLHPSLEAVALGTALGALGYMLVLSTAALRAMEQPARVVAVQLLWSLAPLGYVLAWVLAIDWATGSLAAMPIRRALIGEALLVVACAPWLWKVGRGLLRAG